MKKNDIENVDKDIDAKKVESYFEAIQAGDIDALMKIETTVDNIKPFINYSDPKKIKTAIELAAFYGHNHVIEHLISLGAEFGVRAMVTAVSGGQIDTMIYLNQGVPEKQRIPFNTKDIKTTLARFCYKGLTLMHVAAFCNQPQVMIFLNEDRRVSESERIPYNVVSETGYTPMHLAAASGQTEIMFFLNQNYKVPAHQRTSYNIYNVNAEGIATTPIILAIINGQNEAIDFLAKNLAKAPYCMGNLINVCPTAMHLAASFAKIETMKYLANKGFRYNEKLSDGTTPMHSAAKNGQLWAMKFLNSDFVVPYDQRTPYNVKTNDGKTPLDEATAGGHNYIVDFLNDVTSLPSNAFTYVTHNLSSGRSYSFVQNRQQNRINDTDRNVLVDQPPQVFGAPRPTVPLLNKKLIVSPPKVSSPYDEILRRLDEQEKKINTLFNQQKNAQNFSNQRGMESQSPEIHSTNQDSLTETLSSNKRYIQRDKTKSTTSVERNKRQKTICTTTETIEALKGQGFLGQERKNSHSDQEIIYAGDHSHPLGGQSLDNLARMAKIKIELAYEENEVDSLKHGN